jgi:hypothetical protein
MHRCWFARMLVSVVGAVAGIVAGAASQAADLGETWPQWRGPNRDGFVRGTTWPTSLSDEHLKLAWHVDLGPGYPGPIVAADRVFVAETSWTHARSASRRPGVTWPCAASRSSCEN